MSPVLKALADMAMRGPLHRFPRGSIDVPLLSDG